MAFIVLEGMRFHAHHGYYEEENVLGNDFVVDLIIKANTVEAAKKDDLHYTLKEEPDKLKPATVNYETAFLLCKAEMRQPAKLLETVASRILVSIGSYFENIEGAFVRLQKLHPPLRGQVDSAAVVLSIGNIDTAALALLK